MVTYLYLFSTSAIKRKSGLWLRLMLAVGNPVSLAMWSWDSVLAEYIEKKSRPEELYIRGIK